MRSDPNSTAPRIRLRIPVVTGVGRGTTLLSAFDDALLACGVCNYNLIPLSSVIPPASDVVHVPRFESLADEHGHRLYVVKAEIRSDEAGAVVAAGVGWYQWGDDPGVFVEHETIGATRESAEADIHRLIGDSLRDLCTARDVAFRPERVRSQVACAEVSDRPRSALVLAVFRSEGWQ